ncbi:hypothetical protein GCM10011356_15150 [Kangiella profundi]|nr:hypothetical protein GCM10011356_15150 [Kangiella profundi]
MVIGFESIIEIINLYAKPYVEVGNLLILKVPPKSIDLSYISTAIKSPSIGPFLLNLYS